MGSVWLTIPSARPPEECAPIFAKWRARGYRVAIVVDSGKDGDAKQSMADVIISSPDGYRGYSASVNALITLVMAGNPAAEWFIAAGDDTEPDPDHTAKEIAAECHSHFYMAARGGAIPLYESGLFGVMQPTGDRWHEGVGGFKNAPIDRVCGSAWYGREYCRRMYQGQGPLFPGYLHMFEDEEAQEVAIKMGVLWQRRDLTQRHNHWGRGATEREIVEMHPGLIPEHLKKWNTGAHWNEAQALFRSRKAAGFPGHEPIP